MRPLDIYEAVAETATPAPYPAPYRRAANRQIAPTWIIKNSLSWNARSQSSSPHSTLPRACQAAAAAERNDAGHAVALAQEDVAQLQSTSITADRFTVALVERVADHGPHEVTPVLAQPEQIRRIEVDRIDGRIADVDQAAAGDQVALQIRTSADDDQKATRAGRLRNRFDG
jgi:hypothetical protein